MSLVPSLTCSRKRRDILNGRRNTFTFVANLFVLGLALFFFQIVSSEDSFMYLGIFSCGIGLLFAFFFLIIVREELLCKSCMECVANLNKELKNLKIT